MLVVSSYSIVAKHAFKQKYDEKQFQKSKTKPENEANFETDIPKLFTYLIPSDRNTKQGKQLPNSNNIPSPISARMTSVASSYVDKKNFSAHTATIDKNNFNPKPSNNATTVNNTYTPNAHTSTSSVAQFANLVV